MRDDAAQRHLMTLDEGENLRKHPFRIEVGGEERQLLWEERDGIDARLIGPETNDGGFPANAQTPPAALLRRRPCSRAPPAAALAPADVGLPQTPRPRSGSSWLSDAPHATLLTPAPLPRSSPANQATSARSLSRPWLLRPCSIGRP